MSNLDEILHNCVKEVVIRFDLKNQLQEDKGVEEFLYPYINVCIFQKLCKESREQTIERLGLGTVFIENKNKPDFILETRDDIVLGELKLAKTLNDLIFGYQSGSFDCSEKLASFVRENGLFGIGLCDRNVQGKKKIKDGFLVDIIKLRNLIVEYLRGNGSKEIRAVAIGIVEFKEKYRENGCIEEFKKKLEEGINKTLEEKSFLPYFEEESIKNIKSEITSEELNGFLIFKCSLWNTS